MGQDDLLINIDCFTVNQSFGIDGLATRIRSSWIGRSCPHSQFYGITDIALKTD